MQILRRALFFVSSALVLSAFAAEPPNRAQWIAAAKDAYQAIVRTHPSPFHATSREQFEAELAALKIRAEQAGWNEFIVALRQFVALTRDGHTAFHGPPEVGAGFTHRYPVRFYSFAEGLHVTRAPAELPALFGRPVVTINGRPTAEVLDALASITGGESPLWPANWAPVMLTYPGFLQGLRLADDSGLPPLRLGLAAPEGRIDVVEIAARPAAETVATVSALEATRPGTLSPRFLRAGAPNLAREEFPEHRALYVNFRGVNNEPVKLADFARQLEADLAAKDFEKLIIDVRGNGGGNNLLLQPLVHAVIRSPKVNRPGGVLVLTGRATFSAAMNFCTMMERETQAMFVGEPTGAAPNHYGDATGLALAESGLTLWVSVLRWFDSNPKDPRRFIRPDVAAQLSYADYEAGRDSVLEAALAYRAPADAPVYPPNFRWRRDTQKLPWPPASN